MRPWLGTCVAIVVLVAAGSTPALSQTWPEIELISAERAVFVQPETEDGGDSLRSESTEGGLYVDQVFAQQSGIFGSFAQAEASQDTVISRFSISGSGEAWGSAQLGGGDEDAQVSAIAEVQILVQFTVPVETQFSLAGSFDLTGPGVAYSFGTVSLFHGGLTESAGFSPGDPPESRTFRFPDASPAFTTLEADSLVALEITLYVEPLGGYEPVVPDALGEALATVEFSFDVGDRDGDGLLDAWETDGIDFDGQAPPDIDLPGMGANPDVKDIFVEVDIMDGVPFFQESLDAVEYAFAYAPAWAVKNYDGSPGIQLHLVVDGDSPGHQPLILPADGLPAAFYSDKEFYFGSEDDRNHLNWDEIRAAKLKIFRYCLWVDTVKYAPPSTRGVYGIAEGIPSNDFLVAAGELARDFSHIPAEKIATTLMHELGHTLGLRHGGQDDENYKPNYLSIMNYAYVIPFQEASEEGTTVASYWKLDYSRSTMIDLDETRLFEVPGLGGPLGRMVKFNSRAASDSPPVIRIVTFAHRPYINWNNNDDRDEGPYQQDITRVSERYAVHYDSTLRSYIDWDRLRYALDGGPEFNDLHRPVTSDRSPAMDRDEILEYLGVEWSDQTIGDDFIFADDFELGAKYWSATVP